MNETVLTVCVISLTVAIIAAVVYFIVTMVQVARATKKLEETLDKANNEIDSIHKISEGIVTVASLLPKTWIKIVSMALPLVTPYIFKKKKN